MQQEQSKSYLGSNVSHGTARPVIPAQTTCANTGESKISLPETDDSREHEICDLRLPKLPQENNLCEEHSPITSESIESTSGAISGAEEARLSSLLDMFTAASETICPTNKMQSGPSSQRMKHPNVLPQGITARRRKRNRILAKESRERRKIRVKHLEDEVNSLQSAKNKKQKRIRLLTEEKNAQKARIQLLETEKKSLIDKIAELEALLQ